MMKYKDTNLYFVNHVLTIYGLVILNDNSDKIDLLKKSINQKLNPIYPQNELILQHV